MNTHTKATRSPWTVAASFTAAVVTVIGLLIAITPTANAETPAERCKRETTAYNTTWKNTWAQANPGKNPSDAPPPPVPYKCGGGNDGPPPTPPSTSAPTAPPLSESTPPPSTRNDGPGPSLNAPATRREIEHPGPDSSPIGRNSRDATNPVAPYRTHAAGTPIECPAGYTQSGERVNFPPNEIIECYKIVQVTPHLSGDLAADPPLERTNCTSNPMQVSFTRGESVQVTRQVTQSTATTNSNEFSAGAEVSAGPAAKIIQGVKLAAEYSHSSSTTISRDDSTSLQKTISLGSTDSPIMDPGERLSGTPTYTEIDYMHAYAYRTYGSWGKASYSYSSGKVLDPDGGIQWNTEAANCK